jgi:hypothetical protein
MNKDILNMMMYFVIKNCDEGDCDKCFVKDICDNYQAPIRNFCRDWKDEDIKEAYLILDIAEREEW